MGLIDRIFKGGTPAAKEKVGPATQSSTQFYEDEGADSEEAQGSRNAPRRELVQVILRDTMRKHGIPSDWIECRMLSAVTRTGRRGLHVNFVVKQAHDRLLPYVFPFQDSFERELTRFEPRCRDWLLSLGWEFTGVKTEIADPKSWFEAASRAAGASGPVATATAPAAAPSKVQQPDDEIEQDLQALFAIRDAALADTSRPPAAPEQPDFEPTHPPDEDPRPRR